MLYHLRITNNKIYINDISIMNILNTIKYEEYNNKLKVYTITNVVFCNNSGILTVYVLNNQIKNMIFTIYNLINIYNIPNIPNEFEYTFDKIVLNLQKTYRQIDKKHYFNKKFRFTISTNLNNISILITKRKDD